MHMVHWLNFPRNSMTKNFGKGWAALNSGSKKSANDNVGRDSCCRGMVGYLYYLITIKLLWCTKYLLMTGFLDMRNPSKSGDSALGVCWEMSEIVCWRSLWALRMWERKSLSSWLWWAVTVRYKHAYTCTHILVYTSRWGPANIIIGA